jgi:hypothetical protein
MASNKTTDCNMKQWRSEIKRQRDGGEITIMVRSNLGGSFCLGELPNDPAAERLEIISVIKPD